MFLGFKEGETLVKMKKINKNKSLASSWESPFIFVRYLNGRGFLQQDEGGKIYVDKGEDEKLWDKFLEGFAIVPCYNYRVKTEGFSLLCKGDVTFAMKNLVM